ncbi:MAG: RHS repeat-associated core domain-containing protein, partial [Bacteroidota bacterium]
MVSIYDDYGRLAQKGYASTAPNPNAPSITTLLEEYFYDGFDGTTTISGNQYIGRLRKQRIKQLEDNGTTGTWIETTFSYDACGRMTSSTGTNHLSGTETITQTFDAADNLLTQHKIHTGPDGSYTCNKTFTYDHVGRALDSYMQINGGPTQQLSRNSYTIKDELDRLELGIFGSDILAQMDYHYNDQGWLTQINAPLPGSQDDMPCTGVSSRTFPVPSDLFYLKLNYDAPINNLNTDVYKNGNITSMEWQSPMKQIKGYGFSYDFNNQLKKAIYGQIDGVAWLKTDFYSTEYSYDKRGNIMTLMRNGRSEEMIGSCFADEQIDNLTYTYANNSNQMMKVDDSSPCPSQITLPETINSNQNFAAEKIVAKNTTIDCRSEVHIHAATEMVITEALNLFGDCQNGGITTIHDNCPTTGNPEGFAQNSENGQYAYDNAGNMITDPNKNISIQYNHLNLPFKVSTISGVPKELLIEYDALGTKLSQSYLVDGVLESRRDYINGIEYRNSIFESMQHEQGRAVKDASGGFLYEYQLKDHLGNVRVRIADINGDHMIDPTESPGNPSEVLSIESHYPFGLTQKHTSNTYTELANVTGSRYGYNGKELVTELDLNWMPYGKRMFDPATARFISVDPISDQFPHVSTYNYAENEPVGHIDLHGLQKAKPEDPGKSKLDLMTSPLKGKMNNYAKIVGKIISLFSGEKGTYTTPGGMVNTMEGGRGEENHRAENPEGGTEVDEIVAIGGSSANRIKTPFLKMGKKSQEVGIEMLSGLAETVDKSSTAGNKLITIGENTQKLVDDFNSVGPGDPSKQDTVIVGGREFSRTTTEQGDRVGENDRSQREAIIALVKLESNN